MYEDFPVGLLMEIDDTSMIKVPVALIYEKRFLTKASPIIYDR